MRSITQTGVNFGNDEEAGYNIGGQTGINIGYMAGTIPTPNYLKFARNIHRISRGNIIMKQCNFDRESMDRLKLMMPEGDDKKKDMANKSVVLLIYTSGNNQRGNFSNNIEIR